MTRHSHLRPSRERMRSLTGLCPPTLLRRLLLTMVFFLCAGVVLCTHQQPRATLSRRLCSPRMRVCACDLTMFLRSMHWATLGSGVVATTAPATTAVPLCTGMMWSSQSLPIFRSLCWILCDTGRAHGALCVSISISVSISLCLCLSVFLPPSLSFSLHLCLSLLLSLPLFSLLSLFLSVSFIFS